MMRYKIKLSTEIIIAAENPKLASERRYMLLHELMNKLLLDNDLKDFIISSAWIHQEPEEIV